MYFTLTALSRFGFAVFQVLSSHVWLVATVLESTRIEYRLPSSPAGVGMAGGGTLAKPNQKPEAEKPTDTAQEV